MPFLLWSCYFNAVEIWMRDYPEIRFIYSESLQPEFQFHLPVPVVYKWQILWADQGMCRGFVMGKEQKKVKCCNSEMMWWAVCWPTPLTLTPNAFLLPLLPHNPSRESRCPLLFRPWHNRGMVPLSQNNVLCGFLGATVASRQCWSVR